MPGRAPITSRVATAAARRAVARDLAALCGRTLGFGALTALALVVADKLAGGLAPWLLLVVPPLGMALIAGIGWAVARAWTRARAAQEVDRALGLKDKLSTALAFDDASPDDPFVRWAIDDAERAARTVKLKAVIPLRLDWTWLAWPTLGGAAIAIALLVAPATWRHAGPTVTEQVAQRSEAAKQIEQARQDTKQSLESTLGDAAAAAHDKSLEELQRELAAGTLSAEQARARAAGEMQALADQLSAESQSRRIEQDRVAQGLNAMKPAGDSPTTPMGEAIRDGDLKSASDAAEQMLGQADALSPEERRDLADQLDGLADAMREPPAPTPDRSDGLSQETQRDLADRGVPPEKIEQLSHPTEPEPIAKELQQRGAPPEEAQKVAEKIAEENRRRQAERNADDGLQDLRDMLKRGAEELRNPPRPKPEQSDPAKQPPKQGQPQQDQNKQSGQDQSKQDGSKQDGSKQDGSKEQGADKQPGDKGQPKGDKQGGEQKDGKGQGEPTKAPGAQAPAGQTSPQPGKSGDKGPKQDGGQPKDQPGGSKDQPGTQPGQQPGQKPGEQPGSQPGTQGDKQPGQGPGGDQPGAQQQPGGEKGDGSGKQPGQKPGQPNGTKPSPGATKGDGSTPTGGDGGQGDGKTGAGEGSKPGSGLQGLRDRLQRLAHNQQQAERSAEEAEKLRQRAQELLDKSTPQEREDLRRWAEELAREQPPAPRPHPVDTVTVDARGDQSKRPAGEQRVIAQWLSDKPIDRTAAPSTAPADEPFQEAAKGAERAIEQQVVPGRYSDLVRRVFRRYSERTGAPPAPPQR